MNCICLKWYQRTRNIEKLSLLKEFDIIIVESIWSAIHILKKGALWSPPKLHSWRIAADRLSQMVHVHEAWLHLSASFYWSKGQEGVVSLNEYSLRIWFELHYNFHCCHRGLLLLCIPLVCMTVSYISRLIFLAEYLIVWTSKRASIQCRTESEVVKRGKFLICC